jgi:TBC1 domain family member 13
MLGVAESAEQDAFFCFTNVMIEIRDNFCKTLDHSDLGITATMKKLNLILQRMDRPLWQHLV